jgi:hypothetical protein
MIFFLAGVISTLGAGAEDGAQLVEGRREGNSNPLRPRTSRRDRC